jgi:aspartyl/glutamyl-tRNA(Asn/Gln) amidotransferase C subunit
MSSEKNVQIEHDEIVAIAKSSYLELDTADLGTMVQQVEEVVAYARGVKEFDGALGHPVRKNKNIFREDRVHACNPQEILSRAPATEGFYFVVPLIIENY